MNPLTLLGIAWATWFGFDAVRGRRARRRDENLKLAELLERVRAKYKLPALAGAVVTIEGVIDQAAVGVRKAGTSIPVTVDDLWHLGSETKAMTALLVGTFVAEGRLAWTDPALAFFPQTADAVPAVRRGITVAQLLSHRAGIAENYPRDRAARLEGSLPEQRRQVAAWLLQAPAHPAGSFHYSNGGYVIVGAILEQIAGADWEKLMRERVFAPLGMRSAGFGGTGSVGEIDQPWPHLPSGTPRAVQRPADGQPALWGPGRNRPRLDDRLGEIPRRPDAGCGRKTGPAARGDL